MTKVELYKSRVFVTIIHLCALGQFAYGLYYSSFEVQRSYKLKTSFSRRLVPETFPQKLRFLSYWSLYAIGSIRNMLRLILVLLLALLALEADGATIKWHSAGAAFTEPAAWLDGYLPCAHDLAVFPSHYPAVMPLPNRLSIGGFVLPRLGGLLLQEDGVIELATGTGLNSECGSEERRAQLKPPKTSKWFDPNSWSVQPQLQGTTISSSSSWVTDLDRLPCDGEHVVISGNSGPLSFDLQNVQRLGLGQLVLAGSSISHSYLQELMGRDLGQLLFHNAQYIIVEYYRGEVCGCHRDFESLLELVCSNVQTECETPHCVAPLRPKDSCCLVCGAIMQIPMEQCVEEDRKALSTFINNAIAKEQLQHELQVHINFLGSTTYGNSLQAIVVDRHGYNERSVEFMQRLAAMRNQSGFLAKRSRVATFYSGHPYNPNVSFTSVLLILFCLVFVGVVTVIILAHLMPQNPYLNRIPQWIHDPRRWHWRHLGLRLPNHLLFNRFDNVTAGGGGAAGAANGIERLAVIGYDAENEEVRERAFNNPMFEQAEQVAQATASESHSENVPQIPVIAPKVDTGELDNCSVEEQELTEINLDSSEAESDAEAETRE